MTRFYGVLAPHAAMREYVVATPEITQPVQLSLFSADTKSDEKKTFSRHSWSKLLARVFKHVGVDEIRGLRLSVNPSTL